MTISTDTNWTFEIYHAPGFYPTFVVTLFIMNVVLKTFVLRLSKEKIALVIFDV